VAVNIPGAIQRTFSDPKGSAAGGTLSNKVLEFKPRPPKKSFASSVSSLRLIISPVVKFISSMVPHQPFIGPSFILILQLAGGFI
jgi:hypothetical protein